MHHLNIVVVSQGADASGNRMNTNLSWMRKEFVLQVDGKNTKGLAVLWRMITRILSSVVSRGTDASNWLSLMVPKPRPAGCRITGPGLPCFGQTSYLDLG